MAHFAALDENNIVTEVIVVDNSVLGTHEDENNGLKWLADFDTLRGSAPARWLQTSYSGKFRGVFACVGYPYDPIADVFTAPVSPPIPTPTP